jgi:stage IV sporulation protein FB
MLRWMLPFSMTEPTRFDLNFRLFGIPVRIQPWFWAIAALLGLSNNLLNVLMWVVIVLISVLVHEFGHALTMRAFGQGSSVLLYGGGGLAIPEEASFGGRILRVGLTLRQHLLVLLAGPFAGFALGALALGVTLALGDAARAWPLSYFLGQMIFANVAWGVINLLPVFPLDGGQISQRLFDHFDPRDGIRKSMWLSVIVGGLFAAVALLVFQSTYTAVIFGLLAFQSFMALRGR